MFLAEGMNSAKALRLEVTGVFQEQQEGRCGCNRMSKGRGRERQARERRRARVQGLAGLITMSAFVLRALGDSQGERNDPA